MNDDGTGTGPDNPGTPTQGGSDDPNAAAGKEYKFTDDDMAAAKASWEKRHQRNALKAITAREREIFDELEVDDIDEVRELLTGKRQEQSEAEATAADLKKENRQYKRQIQQHEAEVARLLPFETSALESAKQKAVVETSAKLGAHADLVGHIVASKLGVSSEGEVYVKDLDGEPADTTVEQLIKTIVSDDPRLLQATQGTGGGSQPPTGAPQAPQRPQTWQDKIRGPAPAAPAQPANLAATLRNPFGKGA